MYERTNKEINDIIYQLYMLNNSLKGIDDLLSIITEYFYFKLDKIIQPD